eukprot:6490837-Amphidinium_carterae.1
MASLDGQRRKESEDHPSQPFLEAFAFANYSEANDNACRATPSFLEAIAFANYSEVYGHAYQDCDCDDFSGAFAHDTLSLLGVGVTRPYDALGYRPYTRSAVCALDMDHSTLAHAFAALESATWVLMQIVTVAGISTLVSSLWHAWKFRLPANSAHKDTSTHPTPDDAVECESRDCADSSKFHRGGASSAMLPTFADTLTKRLNGRTAIHRGARDLTARHLRPMLQQQRKAGMHARTVNKHAEIWRRSRRLAVRKEFSTGVEKGVRPSFPGHFCDRLMQDLHIQVQHASEPPPLTPHHTVGDGNCAWRAVHKAIRMHEHMAPLPTWKKLKKQCVRHLKSKAFARQYERELREMSIQGMWSNSSTYIGLASLLRCEIRVHADTGSWSFCPTSNDLSTPVIHLQIKGSHCCAATLRRTDCAATTHDDCAQDVTKPTHAPDLLVGAGRPKRTRTRRVTLEYNASQTHLFVPQSWGRQETIHEVARALGIRGRWAQWTWRGNNLEVSSIARPEISTPDMNHLRGLVRQLPAGRKRKTLHHEDKERAASTLAFGAKATRTHGLTKATTTHSEVVYHLNQVLTRLLPDAGWQSLA